MPLGRIPRIGEKNGTKRSVLVDGQGRPLGVVIAGANVHDTKLLDATIESIIVERPGQDEQEQHLCLDKGYDNPTGHATVKKHDYIPHIRSIGEDKRARRRHKGKPRRWVVERTLAWLNRWRGLLVRYEKKACNYLGVLKLACALLWYRRLCAG
jgi:putative transposase